VISQGDIWAYSQICLDTPWKQWWINNLGIFGGNECVVFTSPSFRKVLLT
jgi:hypothetical protein